MLVWYPGLIEGSRGKAARGARLPGLKSGACSAVMGIIGLVIVFVMVFGGYMLHGSHLDVIITAPCPPK